MALKASTEAPESEPDSDGVFSQLTRSKLELSLAEVLEKSQKTPA